MIIVTGPQLEKNGVPQVISWSSWLILMEEAMWILGWKYL